MRQPIHRRRLIPLLLAALVLLVLAGPGAPAHAAPEPTLHLSNLTDTSATISWRTASPLMGRVRYGATTLTQTADDERGATVAARTHSVVLGGLAPLTTYSFDLLAGGATDDNGGAHYQFRTGKTLTPGMPETAYGTLVQANGTTPAPDTLVYVTISASGGQSSELAGLTNAAGQWYVDLSAARVTDLSAPFTFGPSDQLVVAAWDGTGAQLSVTLPLDPHFPLPTQSLVGGPVEESLSIPVRLGWQLVNPALATAGSPVGAPFSSIAGSYDELRAFSGGSWQSYLLGAGGTLTTVGPTSGLWLHGTAAATLTMRGFYPARQEVALAPEWNLVGFPLRSTRTPAEVLAAIAGKYDQVLAYEATGWQVYLPDGGPGNTLTQFAPGKSYWIHMTEAATVVITN